MTTIIDKSSFLVRRSRWLLMSFTVIGLAVMIFSLRRLNEETGNDHLSTKNSVVTHNPFQGVAGTVFASDGQALALDSADTENDRYRPSKPTLLLRDVTGNGLLANALEPPLRRGLMSFVRPMHEGGTKAGRNLRLTLDEELQAHLQSVVECFVGEGDCSLLPPSLKNSDARFIDPTTGPRASMAAVVVAEEDSGEVIAMAGGLANCLTKNLKRKVDPKGPRARHVFASESDVCTQYPDAAQADLLGYKMSREIYLKRLLPNETLTGPSGLELLAALWPMPPGSLAKIELAIACVKANLLPEGTEFVRAKYAASSDNDWFKSLSLRCSDAYREVFLNYSDPITLLWPASLLIDSEQYPGWSMEPQPRALPLGALMTPQRFRAFDGQAAKRTHVRPHLLAGELEVLQRSRDIASIAIGGGDHRSYLFSHMRMLRDLGLVSRKVTSASALHLVRDLDEPPVPEKLDWLPDPAGAAQVLDMLSGVVLPGGTAHIAFLHVNGIAPTKDDGLSGKTGTADLTDKEGSQILKKNGAPIPVKLFAARFLANGKVYLVAAQVFRTRDPRTKVLDTGNAAAELGLLARRYLMNAGQRISQQAQKVPKS